MVALFSNTLRGEENFVWLLFSLLNPVLICLVAEPVAQRLTYQICDALAVSSLAP